jgi:xanthine dehydrogenase YagS FAD-binding subunit
MQLFVLKIRDRLPMRSPWYRCAAAARTPGDEIRRRASRWRRRAQPWRDPAAERTLRGQRDDKAAFERAADLLLRDAKGYAHNEFKIGLARRAIVRTLDQAARGCPQSQSIKKIG